MKTNFLLIEPRPATIHDDGFGNDLVALGVVPAHDRDLTEFLGRVLYFLLGYELGPAAPVVPPDPY